MADATSNREFDLIIYGASGFTGRLVVDYLLTRTPNIRWAIAGRSAEKMASVRDEHGWPQDTAMVVADSSSADAMDELAASTRAVLTTVGPYQLYGNALVEACAKNGTDYVDLCGEPAWMRLMIDAHTEAAKASGARIVFSCGFDSVPFDLGVWKLQQEANAKNGAPFSHIEGRVRKMKGTFSGGTAASLQATMGAAMQDAKIREYLKSPYALNPGFEGVRQPSMSRPRQDERTGMWLAPFVMAPINTKNVHRSNAVLGYAYGEDFLYDEMLVTGPGEKGEAIANHVATDTSMMGKDAPKPGEGPSKEEREAGHYDVLFTGGEGDASLSMAVTGDRDPGYGSTSKMITESVLCLLEDDLDAPEGGWGGFYTPASAMGQKLIDRLVAHAGLTFDLE